LKQTKNTVSFVYLSAVYWAPLYLADDCCLVSDSTCHSLRSPDVPTCVLPRTLSSYGDRTLQPLDLAWGILFRSSCAIQTSLTDGSDDSWTDTFFGKPEHGALWLLTCGALEKQLLTYT